MMTSSHDHNPPSRYGEPQPLDPIARRVKHGPILPMQEQPGFLRRWFRR